MKTLLDFVSANLELFLRIIAAAQMGLAVLSFFLPRILDCVKTFVTVGEISDTLRGIFGEHRPA